MRRKLESSLSFCIYSILSIIKGGVGTQATPAMAGPLFIYIYITKYKVYHISEAL